LFVFIVGGVCFSWLVGDCCLFCLFVVCLVLLGYVVCVAIAVTSFPGVLGFGVFVVFGFMYLVFLGVSVGLGWML